VRLPPTLTMASEAHDVDDCKTTEDKIDLIKWHLAEYQKEEKKYKKLIETTKERPLTEEEMQVIIQCISR
jgi:sulfur transfer protein SufE